jgi:Spy/CpxP family protein refolding chaperone
MEETNGRRRFFRNAAVAALISSVAAGIGATAAWAAPGGHGGSQRGGFMGGHGPMSDERIEKMVKHFAVEINATPEQTAKLVEIAKGASKDMRPLREKVRESHKRGMELLSAPTIDRAAIERVRAERMQASEALSKRMSQAFADAAEVLTPDQRKKVAERMQKRHERGQHRGRPEHPGGPEQRRG